MEHTATEHPQSVYCDESGFSGNNMFDERPFFAYAATAIEHEEAKATVEALKRLHRLGTGELKGSRLLGSNRGRKAVLELLQEHSKRIKCILFHKKYALACKFFEYVFEPVLAAKSSLFYSIGFHKFISNLLFFHLAESVPYTEDHLRDFQQFMRLELSDPPHLFGSVHPSNLSPVLRYTRDFARIHKPTITQEVESATAGDGNWVLDVTRTALFTLLGEFGRRFRQMRVICDDSKPLHTDQTLFLAMVNRTDHKLLKLGEREMSLTFNLAGPIEFGSSQEHDGIQISDVAAAAMNYLCSKPRDDFSIKLQPFLQPCLSANTVWPDEMQLDLESIDGIRNVKVLQELVERSRLGIPILDDVESLIARAHRFAISHVSATGTGAIDNTISVQDIAPSSRQT